MQNTIIRTSRWTIGLAFFSFILIGANDGAVGVLLPSMQITYHVGKDTIALLFLAGTAGYFIAAFNNGLLINLLGNRRFLLLGLLVAGLGLGLLSIRPPFVLLLFAIVPIGFGGAILDAGLNSYIAGLPQNTKLLNYLHAFYGGGALLGPLIASTFLAVGLAWNSVYIVWISLAVLSFVGFSLAFKNSPTSTIKEETQDKSNVLLLALRLRVVWIAALFLLFYVGTEVSLGSWSYSFLTEERHGPTLLSGWSVSGYWLGLTLGRLALGKVAIRIGNRRLIEGCLVGVIVGILLVWFIPSPLVAAFGLCLTGFSLGPIFPTTIALTSDMVSSRILPSAIGFLASLGSMGGALFPWLAGNIAQHIGLWTLLPYIITLTIVMLFLWIMLQSRPPAMS